MIPNKWHLNPDIDPNYLFPFWHLVQRNRKKFDIWKEYNFFNFDYSYHSVKSACICSNLQQEYAKSFIYDIQNQVNYQEMGQLADINNPDIIKQKEILKKAQGNKENRVLK